MRHTVQEKRNKKKNQKASELQQQQSEERNDTQSQTQTNRRTHDRRRTLTRTPARPVAAVPVATGRGRHSRTGGAASRRSVGSCGPAGGVHAGGDNGAGVGGENAEVVEFEVRVGVVVAVAPDVGKVL